MRKRLLRFFKTDLFKTSFLNGIANIIKILTGLVSNKIVAVYLGPSGIALLGQFNNFVNIVMSLANLGINNGVTKYIAEYYDDEIKRKKILSTGLYLIVTSSVIASVVVFFGRKYFAGTILQDTTYSPVFVVLAFTLIFFVLNSFLMSVLNGYKEFKKIIITNILSSVFGLLVAVILVIKFGLWGALIGFILSQTLIFFITINWIVRSEWYSIKNFLNFFDQHQIIKLGKFALMTFTTLFASSFIQLQVRTYIINNVSVIDAGYWQGIIRICDLYIVFITTTLSIYYLPKLAEVKTRKALLKEIFQGYSFILPLVILSSAFIYFLRDFIINILFSSSFVEMKSLFLYQLIGNVLKIASWLISYLLVAKAMTTIFIISELSFGLVYYGLTIVLINKFGVIGATYAYTLSYLYYLIFMAFTFKRILKKMKS
ncbi:MAG: O-antigen translocase [Bacteroidales bacterium]|nr:O-antigen translocase [Bacteroidales bacterium]